MAPKDTRENVKPFLNKNKSVKLFKEKKRKRDLYAEQRENLQKRYNFIDSTKITRFQQFPLTKETQRGLKKCDYTTPTEIQLETIALALKRHDILGAAKTGSGKTLAFVVPILERLFGEGWCRTDGLGVLVITPTRELALQIFEVCQNVGKFHDFTMGLVIGGKDLRDERKILNLYNIVICTPGRLLQHMDENPLFSSMNLQMLVLDEADRILDMGFQKEMNAILENLPTERQTLLFSATQTRSVKDLARLSLKNPVYVSVHEHAKHATPEALEQSYIVVDLAQKFNFLWSFIKSHRKQKIIIFMSTCKQVKYTFDVFCRMKPGMSLTSLYGDLHQLKRMERYKDFCRKSNVVMFATDIAARGLDFPNVNWVVQMDCPEDTNTYIHRAGRTARYQQGGESLLILLPSERDSMIKQLEDRKIPVNEIKVHPSKILSIERKMAALCTRDTSLKESAQRAFKSYYKSVFLMKDKTVFDINQLNEIEMRESYAKSLGLEFAPRIRFIERNNKNPALPKSPKSEVSALSGDAKIEAGVKFNASDDSDEDDFLMPKGKPLVESSDEEEEKEFEFQSSKSKKAITKVALAKKILKKKIKPNTVIKFNEDGQVIEDIPRKLKSDVANEIEKDMTEDAYNIEKAKQLMNAEDEVDKTLFRQQVKQKHQEQKRKLKKQRRKEEEGKGVQLATTVDEDDQSEDLTLDPNEMMSSEGEGESSDDDDESNASQSEQEEEDDDGDKEIKPKKRKLDSGEKQKKLSTFSGTDLEDEEMLALHFLGNA